MRQFLLILVSLFSGVLLDSYLKRHSVNKPALEYGSIQVANVSDPAAPVVQMKVYKVIVDGKASSLQEPPRGNGTIWRLNLADGRVVVFATEVTK